MGLLFPLYLLGFAAIAAPIFLHLTRRTPRERVSFSSLMFLREAPLRLKRRSRLEQLLLLALRCLALLLLALAFARPLWKSAGTDVANAVTRQSLYLVDTSASMGAPGQIDRAREVLLADLRGLKPGDRAAAYQFSDRSRAIIDFDEWNQVQHAAAIRRLEKFTLATGGGSHLGEALVKAAHHVEDHARDQASSGIQEIVVISDLQEGLLLDELYAFEWPKHIQVRLLPIEPATANNASLQWVQDIGGGALPEETPTPWVRIRNQAGADQTVFQLAWSDTPEQAISIEVPAGQSKVLQAPRTLTGIPGKELVLSGDTLDYDNRLFLAPVVEKQINVLFIGTRDEKDAERPYYFLRRALLDTRVFTPVITVRRGTEPMSGIDPSAIDFCVITEPPADPSLIQHFLEAGGTVLYMVSAGDSGEALRSLTGEALTIREAAVKEFALMGHLDLNHALLKAFSDPQFGDFSNIHFWHHRIIEGTRARVLARFDGRHPALLEATIGTGHLVILSAGWEPADSQLSLSSRFVALLYSLLEYAQSGLSGHVNMFVTGSAVPIPEGITRVQGREGDTYSLPEGLRTFTDTQEAGIYHFLGPGLSLPFAVNLPPTESRIGVLPQKERTQLANLGQLSGNQEAHGAAAAKQDVEHQQKLWRWLIVGIWAALLLETGIAGRSGRPTGNAQTAESTA